MADENGNGVRITNRDIWEDNQEFKAEVRREFASAGKRIGRLEIAVFGGLLTLGTILGKMIAG